MIKIRFLLLKPIDLYQQSNEIVDAKEDEKKTRENKHEVYSDS